MKNTETKKLKTKKRKLLIKKCHQCGDINESHSEIQSCKSCRKGFLPLHYFVKIHTHGPTANYEQLFSEVEDINEEDLIRGIYVIW